MDYRREQRRSIPSLAKEIELPWKFPSFVADLVYFLALPYSTVFLGSQTIDDPGLPLDFWSTLPVNDWCGLRVICRNLSVKW